QREHQDLGGDKNPAIVQTQYGPAWMGSPQGTNPNNVYLIDQRSDEHAAKGANQNDQIYSNCDTTGNCRAREDITQNGNHQQNSCDGSVCHTGLIVSSTGGTTTCTGFNSDFRENAVTAQETSSCPFPPSPPPPASPPVTGPTI